MKKSKFRINDLRAVILDKEAVQVFPEFTCTCAWLLNLVSTLVSQNWPPFGIINFMIMIL